MDNSYIRSVMFIIVFALLLLSRLCGRMAR